MTDPQFDDNRHVILVIDDDPNFRAQCIEDLSSELDRLDERFKDRDPWKEVLTFRALDSLESFGDLMAYLKAWKRVDQIVYAIVDLKLPTRSGGEGEDDTPTMIRNGKCVLDALDQAQIPKALVSSADSEIVAEKVLRKKEVPFIAKTHFERACQDLARQIHEAPLDALDLAGVREIESPGVKRLRPRKLPLAAKSSQMHNLISRIERGTYKNSAAILLIGEEGVEFEQIGWLLYYEALKAHDPSPDAPRFRPINCVLRNMPHMPEDHQPNESEPIKPLHWIAKNLPTSTSQDVLGQFLFVENIHALEEQDARELGELLATQLGAQSETLRIILTGYSRQVDNNIMDLFALAGYPDFFIIDIRPLRERREDISSYLSYYEREWNRNEKAAAIRLSKSARQNLISSIYKRNFKELAIRLDELFRNCSGKCSVLTTRDVRRILDPTGLVSTISQRVIDQILKSQELVMAEDDIGSSEAEERWGEVRKQLSALCHELVLALEDDRGQEEDGDELWKDLQRIRETLLNIESLRDDPSVQAKLRSIFDLWPLERYPLCASIVRELKSRNLDIVVTSESITGRE